MSLTQMTIISTTVEKNPLEEMEQPSQSTKKSEMQYLGAISKNDRMISVRLQDKPFNITVIQVYAPITNTKEVEVEWFYENLQDLSRTNTKKKMSFSSQGTGMQKQKVKRCLEQWASLALENKMKQGKD